MKLYVTTDTPSSTEHKYLATYFIEDGKIAPFDTEFSAEDFVADNIGCYGTNSVKEVCEVLEIEGVETFEELLAKFKELGYTIENLNEL